MMRMSVTIRIISGLLVIALCGPARLAIADADTPSLAVQRAQYSNARQALKTGHYGTFKYLMDKLQNYPLHNYLEYDYLRKNLSKVSNEELTSFLQANDDSPVADQLRYLWLRQLARTGEWQTFMDAFAPGGGRGIQCLHTIALFKMGRTEEAMSEADSLWLVDDSQPRICDPVFEAWRARGGQTSEMVWSRINLAMDRGRLSLAKFLAKDLEKADRAWVDSWISMHHRPAENLLRKVYKSDVPVARHIVRYGLKRLAKRDSGAAADAWDEVRESHLIDGPEEVNEVDQYIALQGAYQRHPKALEWLGRLQNPSKKAQDWRIRTALSQQDWWAALTWIEALPPEERDTDQWRYWRARILEMQSRTLPVMRTASERIFGVLAKERSYHGFLAADRLGEPYQFNYTPLRFSEDELARVAKIPGIARAYELRELGLNLEARREWYRSIENMEDRDLQIASVLADTWGWHDRAIMTVAKSSHYDDLELRFPMAYKDLVMAQSDRQNLDPAWVYGILRQESSFMPDARSGAGALGLMQLMPKTGRVTAKSINTRIRSNREILDVSKNIQLGTAYLRRMLNQTSGHGALATASYNAGPYRVKQWMPKEPMAADLWVDTIPFSETREYVRRVMAYTVIYDKRLDGEVTQMRVRMPVVSPSS